MAITTVDGIINGLGNSAQQFLVNKATIANQLAGGFTSLWRATGTPGQAAIPSTAAVIDNTITGAFAFTAPGGGAKSYLARSFFVCGNSGTDIQIHDRLAHMGGLSGTATGAQTVGVDVSGSGSNMAVRRGASDYSNVQWWLEIYTDIGTTGVTATITYTNAAGTAGRTTTITIGGASPANRAGRFFPIIGSGGEFIQSIQTIQHATTGTAGSYGITATKIITTASCPLLNYGVVYDWAQLGFPVVADSACLFLVVLAGTTSSGTVVGTAKLIQG